MNFTNVDIFNQCANQENTYKYIANVEEIDTADMRKNARCLRFKRQKDSVISGSAMYSMVLKSCSLLNTDSNSKIYKNSGTYSVY